MESRRHSNRPKCKADGKQSGIRRDAQNKTERKQKQPGKNKPQAPQKEVGRRKSAADAAVEFVCSEENLDEEGSEKGVADERGGVRVAR